MVLGWPSVTARADSTAVVAQSELPSDGPLQLPDLLESAPSRRTASGLIQILLMVTVLSLAPAIMVMVTCFTRIIVVLTLTRQALGTAQLPPTQILVGLAILLTILIMAPTWTQLNSEALQPYLSGQLTASQAVDRGQPPLRAFMIRQIDTYKNHADVWMFLKHTGFRSSAEAPEVLTWADVPTRALVPAFVISELKTAFLMGFKIYLPFLVIDMVVASILISMGMLMLPPVLVSLPFKILLFVLVDGWHLLVGSLLESFTL
ncbi:MAG: flagellar type III secretion system pore protein FliP [Actinobacteria bacterium]|nr:flagellar type III secretion system pore protein FliP [Actinomycetota bacterium]